MKTWTSTVFGATCRRTAGFGRPPEWWLGGHPIVTGTGYGWLPGDLRHSTTAAGRSPAVRGCGFRDGSWSGRYTLQHWWLLLEERASASRYRLAAAPGWRGFHSVPGKYTGRPIT